MENDRNCDIYRVSQRKLFFSKLALRDKNMQVRSRLCAIYSPICKLAKKNLGKKILNVTTVKLLLENKIQCFWGFLMPFCFKLYLKVNIHPFHSFLLIIA